MSLSKKSALLGAVVSLLCLSGCAGVHHVDPASPSAEKTRAAEQIAARGDAAGAMAFYRQALEADGQNSQALTGLAGLEEKMGDREAAEGHVRAALEADKRSASARRMLARLLLAKGQPEEAKEQYLKVLDRDEKDLKAVNGLAVCFDQLGDREKAEKLLRETLEKNPQDQATVNNLAFLLLNHGQAPETIALLDPWLTRKETEPSLRQNLSLALAITGQTHRAESIARLDFQGTALRARLIYLEKALRDGKIPENAEKLVKPAASVLEIGPFPTQAMANQVLLRLAEKTDPKPTLVTVLSQPEGTPRFVVRVEGKDTASLTTVCAQAAVQDNQCRFR